MIQSDCQYDVTSLVSDLSKASKVFIEDTDKNFNLIMEIPFRFLGFGDFKVPIVIKKN